MTIDFIIVGAMKAGTTSLAFHLNNHSEIYIPQKELHFFDRDENYKKGNDYYLSLLNSGTNATIIGEKTPTYSYLENVPRRIYEFNPDIKLIWIFRNPINRAYSNYWHAVKKGSEYLSFEEAIDKESKRIKRDVFKGYLKRSIYVEQVNRYLNWFTKEQMYFLVFEDFIKNPKKSLKEVFEFLGTDSNKFKYINEARNKTVLPWSKKLLWLSRQMFGYKSSRVIYKLLTLGRKPEYPKLSKETRKNLEDFFQPYNKQLKKLIEIDLDIW